MSNDNETSFFLVLWFGVSQACLNTEKQSWLEEQALWPIVSGRCLAMWRDNRTHSLQYCVRLVERMGHSAFADPHNRRQDTMADILTNKRPACFNLGKQPTLSSQTVFILLDSWFSNIWYLVFVFCVCLLVFSMSCCCVIMRIVSADNRVLTGSMSVEGRLQKNAYFTSLGLRGTVFSCLSASHTPEPDWKLSGLPWPPRTPIQAAI